MTAGERSLYVFQYKAGRVLRVDPRTGEVPRSPETCGGPQGLAVAEAGCGWRARSTAPCSRSMPRYSRSGTLPTAHAPDAVRLLDDGRVLVAPQAGPTLLLIDPAAPASARAVSLGEEDQLYDQANIDAVVSDGRVFVSSFASDVLLRVELP